jgi:glycerol-3-phosphate dehydrogenase (NAD(P)+)
LSTVAVVGAGGFGTALAAHLARSGHEVRLWARRQELCQAIAAERENRIYLPGVTLPASVAISADLARMLDGAEAAVLALPSQHLRATLGGVAAAALPSLVVDTAKGLEVGSLLRMSEVLESLGIDAVALSGPSHAEEVGRGEPTAVVVAHPDAVRRALAQSLLHGPGLRVYGSADRIGVELGGALKNVLALATGVCEGLGLGDNLRAALLTRGLAEITRLGVACGAQAATFAGLAGLGDLIATVISPHSRNRRAGIALGRGTPLAEVLAATPMVVEGVPATRAALDLARREGQDLPIAAALGRLLFEQADPHEEMKLLLARALKEEERW